MSKRETILKTATRLFAIQGFDGTTTVQIAREAGVRSIASRLCETLDVLLNAFLQWDNMATKKDS
jgi:DNA-binding transcriptional regulator YbjK